MKEKRLLGYSTSLNIRGTSELECGVPFQHIEAPTMCLKLCEKQSNSDGGKTAPALESLTSSGNREISIRFEVKFAPQLYSLLVLGSQVSSSSSNDKIEPCTFFGDTFNSVLFMMKRKCEL